MDNFQATGIKFHLTSGNERMFYQEDKDLVAKICNDLDGQVFLKSSIIIDSRDDVTAFPGNALIGITILTDPLPESFYEREKTSGTVVLQISREAFNLQRLQYLSKIEGLRGPTLSELEFINGERLFFEITEVAVSGMDERNALHNLFARPSIFCRRLDGGFSVWNTSHIVSWSHYPKMEVPANSWQAEVIAEPVEGEANFVTLS